MTVDKWREVLNCYQAALDTPSNQWREFLESKSVDPEVIEKVLRMLEALDQENSELTLGAPSMEEQSRAGMTIGRYNVASPLGRGGMGDVYLGWDTVLDRAVALKFLRHEQAGDPAAAARFVREAKAASALNHPNIVTVYEVLQADNSFVIVMELVEGQAAREFCRAPAPLGTVLNLGRQTALALAAAHANGIIHRDVKPENIMVRGDGYVKLLDFGLARRVAREESTPGGLPAGTLRYMSPEQLRGERLSPATDIFSLGLVLYELAAGKHPFAEDSISAGGVAIGRRPAPDLLLANASPPAGLVSLIRAMLSKHPDQRPAASEVVAALGRIGESSTQKPVRLVVAALVGLLVVFGIALVLGLRPDAQPSSKPFTLRARPLTSQAGWEESPSFSPDGEWVAFSWAGKRNQSRQIYVKRVDTDAPVRLTGPESGSSVIGPLVWSPDGNRIAFKRQHGVPGAIYAIPKQGGEEVELVDLRNANLSSSLDWSPDGTQIVFSDALPETGQLAIYSFHLQTGEKRKLTSPPAEDWGDWDPRFSPDGRTLAFKRVRGYWLDTVYIMPATGGPLRRVTKGSASVWGHDWMPNGDELIVSTQIGGSTHELWRFPLTPGAEPVRITRGGLAAVMPVSSPSAGRIAWVNRLEDTNVYRAPFTGSGSPTQLIASTRRDEGPCYSRDGRIAFASDRSGSWEIWIAQSDGSGQVRVTDFGGPLVGSPRWSPDGRRLTFGVSSEWDSDASKALGRGRVFVLECEYGAAQCGKPERLTSRSAMEASAEGLPSWSWDSAYVYFTSNVTGRDELWKQALAGGAAIQVTHNGGYSSSESRDGKWLYFSKADPHGIWRMPGSRVEAAADSSDEQLLIGPSVVLSTDWALAPDEILFAGLSDDERFRAIWSYQLASGKIRPILTVPEMPESGTVLSVSPDSQWLLYVQLDRSGSNIMVAEPSR